MGASQERNEAGRLPGQDERQILDIIERLRRLPFCEHVPAALSAAVIVVNYMGVVPVASYRV